MDKAVAEMGGNKETIRRLSSEAAPSVLRKRPRVALTSKVLS
jgi:hypothetical protein